MSEVVTLEISDVLAQRARAVAAQTGQRVEDVLLTWIDRAATTTTVDLLPDAEILALADGQLPAVQQTRLTALLTQQREGALAASERTELDQLLALYRSGLVRKAQAVKVAFERGLRPALS